MPKLVNAVLVQSQTNWFWVEDDASISSNERSEGTLPLSNLSNADASRIAEQYLATTAFPQLSIAVSIEPRGADAPYRDYQNADTVTADDAGGTGIPTLVAEIDYTADDEGWAKPVPILNSQKADAWLKFQAWLQANQGGLGGLAAAATVRPPPFPNVINGLVPDEGPYTFSFSGLATTGLATPPQSPELDVRLTVITFKAPPLDTDAGHDGYVGTGSNSVFAVYYRPKGTGGAGTIVGLGGGTWPDGGHPGWGVLTPTTYELDVYVGNEFIGPEQELWGVCLSAGGHTDVAVSVAACPQI